MIEKQSTAKPVILVGPRSTPELTYGMSISFDLCISGFEERNIPHRIIDRSVGMVGRPVGTFTLGGTLASLMQVLRFYVSLPGTSGVYVNIGTSRMGFLRDLLMIIPSIILRRHVVLHLHGGGFLDFYNEQPRWLQFLIREAYQRVDVIIVLGDLLKDQFSFLPNFEELTQIVPNGLPDEMDKRVSIKHNEKKLDPETPISLLYLSNMIESKGYQDVLEACHILHERGIPVHCDFCGRFVQTVHSKHGDVFTPEAQFKQQIADWGLEDIVEYHGIVRGEEKHQRLTEAHVFILPTRYPWEGQPISIIEAMAYGCAVITTNYRGIPEQVLAGINGEYVEFGDAKAIAEAVVSLYKDPERYRTYSSAAVKRFEENFTRKAHLDRLIPVIVGDKISERKAQNDIT